jgi:hypothetical protein
MRLLPKLIINQQSIPRTTRLTTSITTGNTNSFQLTTSLEDITTTKQEITSTILKRSCNVDVDPKNISDRREWATAQYHSYYNPHCLFELEIRWLVATSCILGDLITNWSLRTGTSLGANQVSFHLIPIPCDPFAEFDPLRGTDNYQTSSLTFGGCLLINNKFLIFQVLSTSKWIHHVSLINLLIYQEKIKIFD